MSALQPYKIIIWGPGGLGAVCIWEAMTLKDFQVVGVRCYSDSKVGDAGINELCFMNLGASADPEYSVTFNSLISEVMVRLGGKPLNLAADVLPRS